MKCLRRQRFLCFLSLQDGCCKVYISTSDVQMHGNYHRKDSAIIREGFQRFRATENCNTLSCVFANQKTTHFHCRRSGCSFTFKNKSDMGTCTSRVKAKIHYTSFTVASLQQAGAGKSPLCLLCRVVSQIPLQRLVANKSVTSSQLPRLRGSYGETCVMDFGHYSCHFLDP